MAKRPVFIPQGEVPFVRAIETEFSWNGGFAPSQKQKNIRALHGAFLAAHPDARVLEFPANACRKRPGPQRLCPGEICPRFGEVRPGGERVSGREGV